MTSDQNQTKPADSEKRSEHTQSDSSGTSFLYTLGSIAVLIVSAWLFQKGNTSGRNRI